MKVFEVEPELLCSESELSEEEANVVGLFALGSRVIVPIERINNYI